MKHTFEKDNLQGTFRASELKKASSFTCEYEGRTIAFLKPVEKDGRTWTACSVWAKEGSLRNRLFGIKTLIATDAECLNAAIAWAREEIEAL